MSGYLQGVLDTPGHAGIVPGICRDHTLQHAWCEERGEATGQG